MSKKKLFIIKLVGLTLSTIIGCGLVVIGDFRPKDVWDISAAGAGAKGTTNLIQLIGIGLFFGPFIFMAAKWWFVGRKENNEKK